MIFFRNLTHADPNRRVAYLSLAPQLLFPFLSYVRGCIVTEMYFRLPGTAFDHLIRHDKREHQRPAQLRAFPDADLVAR
jgi:hypothetical protein